MKVEHERDAMSWRAEWIALPEMNIYLSAQLQITLNVLRGMKVNDKQMIKNLELQNGLLLSEKIMFELGKRLGKQTAHHIVYECSMQAFEQDTPFKTVLLNHPALLEHLTKEELEEWLNPVNYLGSAPQKVDVVIDYADKTGLLTKDVL